jgi:hypothetical protein
LPTHWIIERYKYLKWSWFPCPLFFAQKLGTIIQQDIMMHNYVHKKGRDHNGGTYIPSLRNTHWNGWILE